MEVLFYIPKGQLIFLHNVQVGSKFGEGTLGKVLGDGQVGRFKDKGAAAISMFGDMLPAQAAGLFSSIGSAMNRDAQTPVYY